MERKKLADDEINERLKTLNGWSAENDKLVKRFEFPSFTESLAFVNKVGECAEAVDHHPDITFGWGYAEVSITTHDRGGVTDFDLALANQIETLV